MLITDLISDLQIEKLGAARAKLEQAKVDETIIKAHYQENKKNIDNIVDRAWTAMFDKYDMYNLLGNHSFTVAMARPTVAHYKSKKKTIDNLDIPVEARNIIADFFSIFIPYFVLAEEVKPLVGAKPKPMSKAAQAALAPVSRSGDMKMVKDLLNQITEESYDNIVKSLIFQLNQYISTWKNEYTQEKNTTGKSFTPQMMYGPEGKSSNQIALIIVSKVTTRVGYTMNSDITIKSDVDDIVNKFASEVADDIRNKFILKNLKKLVGIIDKKNNLVSAKLNKVNNNMIGLEGIIHFDFADGSYFSAVNSVVFKTSHLGNFFIQYPLTFHSVKFSDGTFKKWVSEKVMVASF